MSKQRKSKKRKIKGKEEKNIHHQVHYLGITREGQPFILRRDDLLPKSKARKRSISDEGWLFRTRGRFRRRCINY